MYLSIKSASKSEENIYMYIDIMLFFFYLNVDKLTPKQAIYNDIKQLIEPANVWNLSLMNDQKSVNWRATTTDYVNYIPD